MDKETMEQARNKSPEQALREGQEILAKAENDWFLLPEEARERIVLETINAAYAASNLPMTQALSMMFRVGHYYGRKGG